MQRCVPFGPNAAMRWRCSAYKGRSGAIETVAFPRIAYEGCGRVRSRRDGAP